MDNVQVGVRVRREPEQLIRADQSEIAWEVDVEVVRAEDGFDFRGPAVQGRRGDRFLYLTWGQVSTNGAFEMFRRAKLMLDRIESKLIESAMKKSRLDVSVDLTGPGGGPRCARVDPPAIAWSVPR